MVAHRSRRAVFAAVALMALVVCLVWVFGWDALRLIGAFVVGALLMNLGMSLPLAGARVYPRRGEGDKP